MHRRLFPLLFLVLVTPGLGIVIFLTLQENNRSPVSPISPVAGSGEQTVEKQTHPPRIPSGEEGASPGPDRNAAGEPFHSFRKGHRFTLHVGWVGTRPAGAPGPEREVRLESPPFPAFPENRPVIRDIRIKGRKPVKMVVLEGPPWDLDPIVPADGGGRLFRLVDPHGCRCPRILRFLLDSRTSLHVDRYLPEGKGVAEFTIGKPGSITGHVKDFEDKPISAVIEVDSIKTRANPDGSFTVRGVHAGKAVVRVVEGKNAWQRCLLQCPGGPYSIHLSRGANLDVNLTVPSHLLPLNQRILVCAVPSGGATLPTSFPAEIAYQREIEILSGSATFHSLPLGWSGVVVFWHPRLATGVLLVESLQTTTRSIHLEERVVISGKVLDATTLEPIKGIRVSTSADSTTVHEMLSARNLAHPLQSRWAQPLPDLGRNLVRTDLAPGKGVSFEIQADPSLKRIGIKVEAAGYLPRSKEGIRLEDGGILEFKLEKDRPLAGANVTLLLPPPPPGGWSSLQVEGSRKENAILPPSGREVRFRDLPPGLYRFDIPGLEGVIPLQVDIEAGANLRLQFSQ